MQDTRNVEFGGMHQNMENLLENINVSKIAMDLQKQWSLICLLKW